MDRQQSTVPPQPGADEIQGTLRRGHELGPPEMAAGDGHAANCQAVPGGQDFLVAARPDALRAGFEQLAPGGGQPFIDLLRRDRQAAGQLGRLGNPPRMPGVILEIGRLLQAMTDGEGDVFLGAQQLADLVGSP